MKKSFISMMCILLTAITVFSGCTNQSNDNVSGGNGSQEKKFEELDCYLLENGECPYTVVIPENYTVRENEAKNELVSFFYEATGITLPVVTDNEVEYSKSSTIISIGKTAVAEELGVLPTYDMVENNGYVIKTVDKSIFLSGYTDFGTLYSAYGFLEAEFDYDYYAPDCYSLTEVREDVKVKAYDIVEKPDIKMMEANYNYIIYNTTVRNRYRMMTRDEIFLPINYQSSVHNSFHFFPLDEYGDCADYYKSDKTDICFTAHGNSESYEEMVDIATEKIKTELKRNSVGTTMIIGQQDINSTCACDACLAMTEKYGHPSAKGVRFCSDVLDRIYEWFETEEAKPYAREFYLLLLAYQQFTTPPVVSSIDFEINDHFGVYLALSTDFSKAKDQIEEQYEVYTAWQGVAKKYSLYTYDINYTNFMLPFETIASKRSLYHEWHNLGYISVFDEGNRDNAGLPTAWCMLKAYVESKIRWNSELDVNELIEKYCYGVYGVAGQEMLEIYWSLSTHWLVLESKIESGEISAIINDNQTTINNSTVWPLNTVKGWLDQYDAALEKIESLKATDEEEFNRINKMIRAERVSPLYMLVALNGAHFSEAELMEYKLKFKEDALLAGNTAVRGNLTVSELLKQWGI